MDFRDHIREIARGKSSILEVGPSYNPIVSKRDGYPVKTLDHASREELVEKYLAFGVPTTHLIEEVDFITTDISSLKLPGVAFDLIVASHVIEHTTDLIAFINSCGDLLSPGGQLALITPDKRFCFDTFRPLTSPGALIDAHLVSRTRHAGAVFDQMVYYAVNGEKSAWGVQDDFTPHLQHTDDEALEAFTTATASSEYYDCHTWTFTPASFQFLIRELRAGEFIELGIDDAQATSGFEFLCILSREASATLPSTLELLRDIDAELNAGHVGDIETLKAQLAEKTAEVEHMRSSRSWKVTRPLRRLREAARRPSTP